MVRSVEALKHRARVLHRRARSIDRNAPPRRHFLGLVARDLGFAGWSHLIAVVEGRSDDFGTLLYPDSCFGFSNVWCADYDEAAEIRATRDDYLLGYRRQFVVVSGEFIEALGLEPFDPAWVRIGRDWVRPAALDARDELFLQLIEHVLPPADPAAFR